MSILSAADVPGDLSATPSADRALVLRRARRLVDLREHRRADRVGGAAPAIISRAVETGVRSQRTSRSIRRERSFVELHRSARR